MLCPRGADNSGSISLGPVRASSNPLLLVLFRPRSPEKEPLANATDFFTGVKWFESKDSTLGDRPRGAGLTLPLEGIVAESSQRCS